MIYKYISIYIYTNIIALWFVLVIFLRLNTLCQGPPVEPPTFNSFTGDDPSPTPYRQLLPQSSYTEVEC